MKKIYLIAFVLLALMGGNALAEAAPDFKAKDINGVEQTLGQYKGKIVVLEWNNPGCPYVKKFYDSGEMQRLQAAAKADDVVWLTVNSGAEGKQGYMTEEAAKKQVAEWKSNAAAYIRDADGVIGHAYAATATPHMFVIDKDGQLVYKGAIDSVATAKAEDIKTAENYVSAALAALKAGTAVKTPATNVYGCGVKYKS